jgi:AraC family transcriptional regulator
MNPRPVSADFNNGGPPSPFAKDLIKENWFRLRLLSDRPGLIEVPGLPVTIVSIHVGPSVQVSCRRGGQIHHGTAVHGDIDIIPAGTPSLWEIRKNDTALVLSLSPDLLNRVAEHLGYDADRIEIQNRFLVRDQQLENIGWALKAEMESGFPCGRLYLDSLAVSVAARLVSSHSSCRQEPKKQNGRMAGQKLRQVLSHIEDNLSQDVSVRDLAEVAELSVSHFKTLFRETMGLSVHQYLIRRRVERARCLLVERKLSISQIALEAGFAHQSHLARHIRRVLGVSPKAVREMFH